MGVSRDVEASLVNPTATMTFMDYEVLDIGVRLHFVSPNPGAGQASDYYITLSDVELAGVTSQAQLSALVKGALNRRLLATGIAGDLDSFIGQSLVLDGVTGLPPDPITGLNNPLMLTPWSPLSLGVELAALATPAPTSTAWGTANLARMVPFTLVKTATLVKGFWANGATANGNVCVGVYNNAAERLCTTGSVAQTGTSVLQEAALTGTLTLAPGRYYLALSSSSATATFLAVAPNVQVLKALGMAQAASAFPLPASITPAALASAVLPLCGVSLRNLVT
jgi:hypothetical protein